MFLLWKFVFQWNFTHITDAQQLLYEIYRAKTNNFSTSTLCTTFTSQWRHTDVVFGSWFYVFSASPRRSTGMQVFSAYPRRSTHSLTHCCAWPAEGRSVLHIERSWRAIQDPRRSTGMQILMLEICWCHFNKFKLKLQIKKYFQQTWYIYVIMFA